MMFKQHYILCGLLVSLATSAQTITNSLDRFDPAGIGGNPYSSGNITNVWANWFGGAFQSLSWDAASDANTNASSGSLKIVANFPVSTDQFEVWDNIDGISPAISGFQFTNFQCDVRFAAGSATNSSGKFGTLEFGVPTPGYGQNYFGNVAVSASNTNWVHVSLTLNAASNTNLQNITGLLLHIWGAGLVGPSTLWVDNIQFVGMSSTGTARIDYNDTHQRIDGFGASSAWDGTWNTQQADIFFSTNTGAGLSLLRTRIAPDGSTVEGGIAQMAQARGARVWSTPWTPTANFKITNSWIRTNNSSSYNGGWISNSAATFQGYASQLAKNVVLMKNTYGVNLYALSIQNEPDANVDYESCQWSAQDFHDFLPYLDAAMTASNVSSTKIMLPESMHWQFRHATNTMSDVTTSNLVDILAGHNYGSSAAPVTQFGTPCPKTLWETEHYFGSGADITNGLALAQQIHSFLTVAEASAYHYWWLKTYGGNGCLAGDSTVAPAKRLYAMGNYSKFIRPNFYRVGVTNNATALVSAFKDPVSSNFVIVAANNSAFPVNQTFTLTNFPVAGPLRLWVTSATESLANRGGVVNLTNNTFATVLPAWTVATFVYQTPVTNSPGILQPPANQLVLLGDPVTFSVLASGGSVPLYYQWLFNGTNLLTGATNATLALAATDLTDAGNYSVIVTNYAGSVTSSMASLSFNALVWSAPGMVAGTNDVVTNGTSLYAYNNSGNPAVVNNVTFTGVNSSAAWGTNVTLGGFNATTTSAFVGGANAPWNNLPTTYQTILQGGAYNSGEIATVTLNNLAIGHQYQVQVWVNDSRSGSTTNRTETLPGAAGSTVSLAYNSTYAAGGVGQFALGTFTASATNQSFTLDGNASTQLNALQVRDLSAIAPSIVQQPANQTNWVNGSVTFVVTASGTAPFFYQWLFNGTNTLPGATNANLTLTGLAATNAGNYSVIVTNFAGSITSAVASLTITTNANFTLKADDGFGASSFNTIGNWTNTLTGTAATFAPTNGYTYATGPFVLRTPAGAGNYSFAGSSLTVSPAGQINLKGGSGNIITFSNLVLNGTINNAINANAIAAIAGNLTVLGGTLNVSGAIGDNRALTNAMTMSGSGALTNFSTNGISYIVYTGDNSAFTGPIIVTNTTLQIAAQANLGGNPASFNDDQLLLDSGTLQPTASFALNQANCGVTIAPNGGVFSIPSGITLTISNRIAGAGTLVSSGGGTLVLAASNTATGNLIASNSTLKLVGNASCKNFLLGISNNAVLDITGLNVPLAISNKIALAGNLIANVNSTNTSSKLIASNLVFGGTLTLNNLGPAFALGNSFPLFTATNYSGAFANIVPAAPGPNLVWDTSKLTQNGTLSINSTLPPVITGFKFSGNNLILSGTNNSPAGSIFYTLAATNLLLPITNWTIIASNQFGFSGGFVITNPLTWNTPQTFFMLRLQ